jgi:hypothetical protein
LAVCLTLPLLSSHDPSQYWFEESQVLPQLPQLLMSVLVSTQLPSQQVSPLQSLPQLPQLESSLLVSMQLPSQQLSLQ